jgi:hypothetical protein
MHIYAFGAKAMHGFRFSSHFQSHPLYRSIDIAANLVEEEFFFLDVVLAPICLLVMTPVDDR